MNIGEVAKLSGVNAKAIRYYESIGLVPEPERTDSGYRQYSRQDVDRLRLVGRARRLGFAIEEVRRLVDIYADKERASSDVKSMVLQHVSEIDQKIAELNSIRQTLLELARRCQDDREPDCRILEELSTDRANVDDRRRPAARDSAALTVDQSDRDGLGAADVLQLGGDAE